MSKRSVQPFPAKPVELSAEDREVATILEQADREIDAGLALSGDAAARFLEGLRSRARARAGKADVEPS